MPAEHDAIVIGAGPDGLAAANVLADSGWDVLVLEAQDDPGGAARSAELEPGFVIESRTEGRPRRGRRVQLLQSDQPRHRSGTEARRQLVADAFARSDERTTT